MADYIENGMNQEIGWDDAIENDSEFTLLPEGDYQFMVIKFERARHNGSDKLPPCNKAIITLEVTDGTNTAQITHNLFLHRKCEGMLCAFFTAIGQRQHGERLVPNWGAVMGAGLILYLNAFGFRKTERFFTYRTFKVVSVCALSFYALSKTYSFFTGANHLHSIITPGVPGMLFSAGLIPYLNLAVGLVVCCTMYAFYTLFRKGDM